MLVIKHFGRFIIISCYFKKFFVFQKKIKKIFFHLKRNKKTFPFFRINILNQSTNYGRFQSLPLSTRILFPSLPQKNKIFSFLSSKKKNLSPSFNIFYK